jgi:hypothetical protein
MLLDPDPVPHSRYGSGSRTAISMLFHNTGKSVMKVLFLNLFRHLSIVFFSKLTNVFCEYLPVHLDLDRSLKKYI